MVLVRGRSLLIAAAVSPPLADAADASAVSRCGIGDGDETAVTCQCSQSQSPGPPSPFLRTVVTRRARWASVAS